MIYLAFRNLFRNVRRTVAIILTVALGAGSLFSFAGFINGILDEYRENTIHAHYGHGQINTFGYRDTVYEEPWKYWIKDYVEIEKYLLEQEDVEYVFPRVTFPALISNGNVSVGSMGHGIDAVKESEFFNSLNIEEGETLRDQEKGIILGKGLANALKVKPGDTVDVMTKSVKNRGSKESFVVTGIFHTGLVDFDSRIFRIQLPEAQAMLKTDRVEQISLGLTDHTAWDKVEHSIEDAYPDLEAIPFNELDKVYYQHSVDWLKAQFNVVQVIILGIVLLAIFNTISAAILERKQEIGNLRANGESVKDIMKLILAEGMLLGIIGSIVGILLSYLVVTLWLNNGILMPPGPGLTRQFHIVFKFDWNMIYRAVSLSAISAIVAASMAGLKVARMPIAKALRSH